MNPRSLLVLACAFLSMTAFGCSSSASGEGVTCSPAGKTMCGDGDDADTLYDCVGPKDGEGTMKVKENCASSGKVCDLMASDGVCVPKEEFCARKITPTPPQCK
jgi:hypothetical protein